MTRLYWTAKEVAEMLSMTEQMVYTYVRRVRKNKPAHFPGKLTAEEMEGVRLLDRRNRRAPKMIIQKVIRGLGYCD